MRVIFFRNGMPVRTLRVNTRLATDSADHQFRKASLRSYVLCVGWLKLISVFIYVGLYFLVTMFSEGTFSLVLRIMTLCTIIPTIILGALLIMGAIDEKIWALTVALWLSLILASYTTTLGAMGGIYFIRRAKLTSHFLIAVIFACLACSVFVVLCHDMVVVHMYRTMISDTSVYDLDNSPPTNRSGEPA